MVRRPFLLVNENGSDNIGDHAINDGLRSLLNGKGYSYHSVPFATRKISKVDSRHEISLFSRLKRIVLSVKPLFHLLWLLRNKASIKSGLSGEYSGVIIGGGQLVLSGFSFPIAMYAWVKYAKENNLPVYVVGIGCGEDFLLSEINLYKKAFKKCDKIFVRNKASIVRLKEKFGVESMFCPDLAFGLEPLAHEGRLDGVDKLSGIVVGMTDHSVYKRYKHEVSGISYTNYDVYLNEWCNRLIKLLKDSDEPVYLASTTYKDAECNRDLHRLLIERINNRVVLIDGVKNLTDYRKTLSGARLVFSGRMHSLILGKVEGCEIEPWIISGKIAGYLDTYNDTSCGDLRAALGATLKFTERTSVLIGYSDSIGGSGTGTRGLLEALARLDWLSVERRFAKGQAGRILEWVNDYISKVMHVVLCVVAGSKVYRTFNTHCRVKTSDLDGFDFVFLTWIGNNTITIKQLIKLNTKIIWRMSDEWAWQGTLHYSSNCKPLNPILRGIDGILLKKKKALLSRENVNVLTPSSWIRKSLVEALPQIANRVHVLPNVIDEFWMGSPAARNIEKINIDSGKVQILLIAKDLGEARKGLDEFRELARSACIDYLNFIAVGKVAGKLVAEDSGVVLYKGMLDKMELKELLASPSIVLSIGASDTSPNSVLEAMAMGALPLVKAESGIVDYLPDDLGRYYKPTFRSCSEMREGLMLCVNWLLNEPDFSRQLVAGHIRDNYGAESVANRLEKILEDISSEDLK